MSGRAAREADRLLPRRFDLTFAATGETVTDIEALVRGVLGAEGWPSKLEPADEAELIGTLFGDAVLLERKYERREGIEARPWLFQRLRFKARDWLDVKKRHIVLGDLGDDSRDDDSGTGLGRGEQREGDRRAGVGDGSHGAPGEVAGDRGDPGVDALRSLLESGDRALLREVEALGLSAPPGARGRDPESRRALERLDEQRVARVERAAALEREARRPVAA